MDIVLPTRFNNTRLPKVVRPGFHDDFNRPAEQGLGVTTDGKEWNYSNSPWHIVEPGEASSVGTSAATSGVAYVDGLSSDGTLTAVCGKAPTDDPRSGIAFRAANPGNGSYIGIWPNTSENLTIYVRVDSGSESTHALGAQLADGDTLSATFIGPDISVSLNGATLYTGQITTHQDSTQHGFMSFMSTSNGTWDSIEFIPA